MARTRTAEPDDLIRLAVAVLSVAPPGVPSAGEPARLVVVEVRRAGGGWSLPETTPGVDERFDDAALRALRDQTGIDGVRPEPVGADPSDGENFGGDPGAAGERLVGMVDVLTYDLLRDHLDRASVRIVGVDSPGRLPAAHLDLLVLATTETRRVYRLAPDPAGLLPHEFSLRDLLAVHGAVAGYDLVRDTFRRAMAGKLVATGHLSSGALGRPAELYRRAR